jgi:hypothetical protein
LGFQWQGGCDRLINTSFLIVFGDIMVWTNAAKEWREKNKERIYARRRECYALNINGSRDKTKISARKFYQKNKEYFKAHARKQYYGYKRRCIEAYSDGKNCCACCGESIFEFLTLDHINGDGAKHREEITGKKRVPRSGQELFHYFCTNNFPDKDRLQVLCWNCNCGKRTAKVCPHQKYKK